MALAEAEAVFVSWLSTAFPSARVVTERPANLADVLPCIWVNGTGGLREEVYTFTSANVDLECFAASHATARTLAYSVAASVTNDLPGHTVAGAFVTRVRADEPAPTPYDNTNVRRFTVPVTARLHTLES